MFSAYIIANVGNCNDGRRKTQNQMTKGHMLKNIKVYQCIFLPLSRVGADSWNATFFIWVIIWGILLQKKSLGIHYSPDQFYYFKKSVLIDKPFNLINHLCCYKYQQKLYLKKTRNFPCSLRTHYSPVDLAKILLITTEFFLQFL